MTSKSYSVIFEDGKIRTEGCDEELKDSLFHNELTNYSAYYDFHFELRSDSWKDLIKKWANLSFEWLHMRGNERVLHC